jgi:hypothetical protein
MGLLPAVVGIFYARTQASVLARSGRVYTCVGCDLSGFCLIAGVNLLQLQ